MPKTLRNFIVDLQKKDESVKRRWLVFLTAVTTVLIVIFWIFYLKATLVAVEDPYNPPAPGTWDIFKNGLTVIGEKVETGLANSYLFFVDKAGSGRIIKIER